jgi:predicted Zn-dependent peptidase
LRLAITSPHFDPVDIERIRDQVLSGLRRETTSPNEMASRRWWSTAFPGHPYGRPVRGTLESIPTITAADFKDYMRRVFARDTLKIAIVGDIDAATAGKFIDKVFGGLPAKGDLAAIETGASCPLAGTITGFPNSAQTLSVMKKIVKSSARWDGKYWCFGSASSRTLSPLRVRFSNS